MPLVGDHMGARPDFKRGSDRGGCTGTLVELPSVSLRFKIVLRRSVNKGLTPLALRIALIGSGSLPWKIGPVLALPLRALES
jgi:hypothetical protein